MKGLLLGLFLLTGCSAAWNLQQAEKHIEKAKQKGADVKSDTTYTKLKFEWKGAKTTFDLGPTILQRKDGVVNKYILKDTVIYKDRIRTEIKDNTVYVECPDEKKEAVVPTAIDTTVSAGYTEFQHWSQIVGYSIITLLVGIFFGPAIKKLVMTLIKPV